MQGIANNHWCPYSEFCVVIGVKQNKQGIDMGRPTASAAEEELYRQIRRAIAERRLEPGVKLAEDALASLFNVSRARVRKVLLLLAKDKIVKHEPNRGAFVWKPTLQEARDILDSRRLIECYLVRHAARLRTPEHIRNLRSILQQESDARATKDNPRMMRLSGEFHIALAECAGNQVLSGFLASLISQSYLILAVYQRHDVESCPQDDHSLIVDSVEKGDEDAANTLLNQHFDHIEAELDLKDSVEADRTDLGSILKPQH